MKTITFSKRGKHYLANVYGIRGQQSQEPNTIVFNEKFKPVKENPDYTCSKEFVCVVAGVKWKENDTHIGELLRICVENKVKGYTTRHLLLNKKYISLLPPIEM